MKKKPAGSRRCGGCATGWTGAFVAIGLAMAAPARADDIILGVATALSGPQAAAGEQDLRGIAAALREINAKGGVLGKQLKLALLDDACDPEQAVTVAQQLVAKQPDVVIGHHCSGASIPAAAVYNAAHVLQISPASTNPVLTDRGYDNVFRVCGRDDRQARVIANYLEAHYKGQPIAVIDDNSAYGKGLTDALRKELKAAAMDRTLYEQVEPGQDDFSPLLTRIKQFGAAAVFYGGYQAEAGLFIKQARDAGLKTQFLSDDALTTKEFWQTAGRAGEGVLVTGNPDPRGNPEAADVVAAFRREHFDPDGYTLFSYAAVQVFAQAVDKAKSTAFADVKTAMHAGTFNTVLGDVAFDPKGDVVGASYVLFRWHNGEYVRF